MRTKLALLLAIAASSVLFLAATPSPASAAYCSNVSAGVSQVATFYGGYPWIYFNMTIAGCSDTDGIRLVRAGSGWFMNSGGAHLQMNGWTTPQAGWGYPLWQTPTLDVPGVGALVTQTNIPIYGVGTCWFHGSTPVQTEYWYKLHSRILGTWDSNPRYMNSQIHTAVCP